MQDHISQSEEQMKKAFTFLSEEYKLVRVGKANPFILDKVKVDYYGNPTPINQIGNITVEARSLIFKPWDASMINQVNKAIQKENLGITPQNDGEKIRLNFPALNQEEREKISKQVSKMAEESKITIRNIRHEILSKINKAKKEKQINEDEASRYEKKIKDITDLYNKKINEIKDKKISQVTKI